MTIPCHRIVLVELVPDAGPYGTLRGHVARLTDRHEAARPTPWRVDDAPADFIDKQLRAIVGIEIPIARLVGKWKTSQNRGEADRAGVVQGLRTAGDAASLAMAELVGQAGG